MQAIPMVRSSSVRPVLDFMERRGDALGPALSGARALLHDPTALIPVPMAGALLDEAVRTSGDAALGIHAGMATRILEFGEWATVLSSARTIGGLLAVIGEAARRFNTGQRFWALQRGDDVWLHWRFSTRLVLGRRVTTDFSLMLVLQGLRLAAGAKWRPDELHVEGPPPRYADELASLASRRSYFDQPYMALVFPARLLAERFPLIELRRPPSGVRVPASDFGGSVRQLVDALLKLGSPDLAVAAEAAHMSERSLQRRLAECGLSFARVVADARFDAACQMLGDPARKIVEISAELGYSDSANFTRAFRRRAGVSPQAFRQTA